MAFFVADELRLRLTEMPHAKTQFNNLSRDKLMNNTVFSWFFPEDNISADEEGPLILEFLKTLHVYVAWKLGFYQLLCQETWCCLFDIYNLSYFLLVANWDFVYMRSY